MNIKTRHGGLEDKSTYVVTEDLFYLVGRWCEKKGVKNAEDVLDKEFFLRLLDSLTKSIKEYCFSKKNVEVVGLDTEAFNDLLMKRDHPSNKKFKEFWVALDDVYPRPREECESKYNISITRYITQDMEEFLKDRSGNDREDMGRGPRTLAGLRRCGSGTSWTGCSPTKTSQTGIPPMGGRACRGRCWRSCRCWRCATAWTGSTA